MKTNLSEKVSRQLLLEHPLLCDKVEEVLAGVGPLHDDDEAVVSLEEVNKFDDTFHVGNSLHQTNLKWNSVHTDLDKR